MILTVMFLLDSFVDFSSGVCSSSIWVALYGFLSFLLSFCFKIFSSQYLRLFHTTLCACNVCTIFFFFTASFPVHVLEIALSLYVNCNLKYLNTPSA
jgi:hypothetical protein